MQFSVLSLIVFTFLFGICFALMKFAVALGAAAITFLFFPVAKVAIIDQKCKAAKIEFKSDEKVDIFVGTLMVLIVSAIVSIPLICIVSATFGSLFEAIMLSINPSGAKFELEERQTIGLIIGVVTFFLTSMVFLLMIKDENLKNWNPFIRG